MVQFDHNALLSSVRFYGQNLGYNSACKVLLRHFCLKKLILIKENHILTPREKSILVFVAFKVLYLKTSKLKVQIESG